MMRTSFFAFLLFFGFAQVEAHAWPGATHASCKKKRKVKPPKEGEEPVEEEAEEEEQPQAKPVVPKDEDGESVEEERVRVENAKPKAELEGRVQSKITPGTLSRWSNRGAMAPIESDVPITKQLPDRALPRPAGVETPGQGLIGGEELLQARLFVSGSHLSTTGQNAVYVDDNSRAGDRRATLTGATQDIDVFRWRMSVAYERIASSDFGTHLDLEYRAKGNGSLPTDHHINELYLSYGLTDFRRDDETKTWGLSVGRLAVREAGYAQTDGILFRTQFTRDLKIGVFGGVTGNPYNYNWNLKKTQEFSADWLRAGGYAGYRTNRFFSNAAIVLTYARLGDKPAGAIVGKSGLDRLYLYLDAAYLVTPLLNVFLTGFVDIVGGHPFQNVELAADYTPIKNFDLRLSVGRFSTVLYDASAAYTYYVDPMGNKYGNANTLVDEEGKSIVPFDAVLGSAVYNTIRARAGYRIINPLEIYANLDLLLRDTSVINKDNMTVAGNTIEFSSLRMTPGGGVRFRDPDILDATLGLNLIVDKQSQASSIIQASLGRGIYGLYAQLDARHYFGTIAGTDGGLDLSYTLPREWFPGRVLFRLMVRYYTEAVPLGRVTRPSDPQAMDQQMLQNGDTSLIPIPAQNTLLGFFSAEWRL